MMKRELRESIVHRLLLMVMAGMFTLTIGAVSAWAGPPFVTDDPEPVELHHWEAYIASAYSHSKDGTLCTAPHVELNYGAFQDTQLHLIVPMVFSHPHELGVHYGLGDIELGVKYRFIHEDEKGWIPQVGTFPIVDLPTGSSERGLGEGRIKILFPIWLQKSWGPWTTYGGGGYWYHPGPGNKDYWFGGWELQREISKSLTLGAEIFGNTHSTENEGGTYGFNAGAIINLSEEHHILLSTGRDIHGPNTFSAYAAFQWTLGPHEEKKNEKEGE